MQAGLIMALAVLCYAGTFCLPLVFDDTLNIIENPYIHDLRAFSDPTQASSAYTMFRSRILGYLSFALNYKIGGLDPRGYHIVNLAVHISSALLVYALFILLIKASLALEEAQSGLSSFAPLFGALLFAVHPVQTQAVTYISQRFASMSAMFVLLSVVSYLASRVNAGRLRYALYLLALVSGALGMKTKETAVMGPVMIALAEWMFLQGSGWRRAAPVAPFLLLMLIVPLTLLAGDISANLIGQAGRVSNIAEPTLGRMDYAITQIAVVTTYLRLLILPIGQNLDYDYPIYHSLLEPRIILGALVLLALAGLGVWLFRRRNVDASSRIAAFGIAWFFITLSLESSLLPLSDVIFEHRVYLPSAGIFISVSALWYGSKWAQGKAGTIIAIAAIVILAEAAVLRNEVWRTEIALWWDVTEKSPNKARPFTNLGNAYASAGRRKEAISAFKRAIALRDGQIEPYANLGMAYAEEGDMQKSIEMYALALRIDPAHIPTLNGYASALLKLGRTSEAIGLLRRAVEIDTHAPNSYYNLGLVLNMTGDYAGAISAYTSALRIEPGRPDTNTNLGAAYLMTGQNEQALTYFRRAVELSPSNPDMHYNMAVAYMRLGLVAQAREAIERALELNPRHRNALEFMQNFGKPLP